LFAVQLEHPPARAASPSPLRALKTENFLFVFALEHLGHFTFAPALTSSSKSQPHV
jgi:hypothetical protein